jgi:WD40 repeat protein/biotin carboxyl carrier protein
MLRFIGLCVALAAACVVATVLVGYVPGLIWGGEDNNAGKGGGKKAQPVVQRNEEGPGDRAPGKPDAELARPSASNDTSKVVYTEVKTSSAAVQPLVLHEGRIVPVERQDVPSERDGKMLFLATPVQPGEKVPDNKLIPFEVSILAVPVGRDEKVADEDRVYDPQNPRRVLRKARNTDNLDPGTTVIVRKKVQYRKLDVGDRVKKGQLLGIINPALTVAEMVIKQQNIEGAEADVRGSIALAKEYDRRTIAMKKLRAVVKNAVTEDEYGASAATRDKYIEEEATKRAAVKKAQSELSQAWTTLEMHDIRASVDGVIKAVYKQNGEAVKNNEAVCQIQNPDLLRVDAQVEIQDALGLSDRLKRARVAREEARQLWLTGTAENQQKAQQLEDEARRLVAVKVEASRVEPPRAVLSGHLLPVTCVAVSKGPPQRIISGSEDKTVRIWERVSPNDNRWEQRAQLDHHAVVRAVACTGKECKKNLLLTATATGRARIFDLDNLKAGELDLKGDERHAGAINCAVFNAKGTLCATGGEDRSICLWDTTDGKLLCRVKSAHRAGVTWLAFTRSGKLLSAGDRRLLVWDIKDEGGEEGSKTLEQVKALERRSGEVELLDVDPNGEHVLFDEGRELRVMSVKSERIEGTLTNPVGTPNFSTLAMYSPDGKTILTNSNGPGRLQLWRAPSDKVRAAELRNFVWTAGTITSGAFDPHGKFVATGTKDNRVLVWEMPTDAEAEKPLDAELTYVEEFLDTSLRKVAVRATFRNPDWVIPGSSATIVVDPTPAR